MPPLQDKRDMSLTLWARQHREASVRWECTSCVHASSHGANYIMTKSCVIDNNMFIMPN